MGGCKSIFSKTGRSKMPNGADATIPKTVDNVDLHGALDVPSIPVHVKEILIPRQLREPEKYHAFISHSSKDRAASLALVTMLENQGFRCFHSDRDFQPGERIVPNIMEGIEKSMRVIALVSENLINTNSEWVEFEVANTRSKERENGIATLIPVLYKIEPAEAPPYVKELKYLQLSDENFWEKLAKLLTEDVRLSDVVPFGNIAHGISWSHYYGYLALVLPGLRERVKKSEFAEKDLLPKIFTILPESCRCPDEIKELDANIEDVGYIECKATRGGKLDRSFKCTVYKVTDPDDGKVYHALLSCPKTLSALYEMEKGRISDMDSTERKRQALLFKEKMEEIVNSSHNPDCHGRAVFLSYKDGKRDTEGVKRLSRVLVDCIIEESKKEDKHSEAPQRADLSAEMVKLDISEEGQEKESSPVQVSMGTTEELPLQHDMPDEVMEGVEVPSLPDGQFHLYISAHETNKKDVSHIKTQLTKKNFLKVFCGLTDPMPGASLFAGEMDNCQKVLTFITDDYMKDSFKQFEQINAVLKGSKEKCSANIPVLHKLQSNEVPSYIKEVNYLLTSDPQFWHRLVKAIVAKNIPRSLSIPTADIAGGLAYAYYYNYLRLILPGLESRLENSQYKDRTLCKKFIILMPKSGDCSKKLPAIDSNIRNEERVDYKITKAGAVDRDYSNSMSRVVNPDDEGEEIYVVLEYATPLWTMYEMEMGRIAGLSTDDKAREMQDFREKLVWILNHECNTDCQNLAIPMDYDDQDPKVQSDVHYLSRAVYRVYQTTTT